MSHVSHYPRRRRPAARSIVFALGAVVALAACKEETARTPEPVRPVKVMKVEADSASQPMVLSGSVKARSEASLGFRVGGKIVERGVEVGDRVEPGTVLARLDATDLSLALRSADANLASAATRREVAEGALARNQALAVKGFVAKSILDQRQLEFDEATATFNVAVSARDQAANQAAYSELKADAGGVVTQVRAEVGQVVAAGTPIVVVARDGDKEVAVAVPENKIRFFAEGDKLSARFWADPAIETTGIVREISRSADPQSRTFAVRISLPADPRIRLGMTATVSAALAAPSQTIVVPTAALSQRDGRPVVWVVDPASQTVAARSIGLDVFVAGGVRLLSGLSAGELVVTAGTQFMTPGKKVRFADQLAEPPTKVAAVANR